MAKQFSYTIQGKIMKDGIMDEEEEREQRHVAHTHKDLLTRSWCGEEIGWGEWKFLGVDHVIYHINNTGGIPWCEDCIRAICHVLLGNTELDGTPKDHDVDRTELGSPIRDSAVGEVENHA